MGKHDIIVIGASAGGIRAIKKIVAELAGDLPAAIFVATHIPSGKKSILPDILNKAGKLPAHHAVDGEPVRPGHIYVALPGYHLIIDQGQVRLTSGPMENGFRPAIDALFRSAARSYGSRVIGIVLTGLLDDGTAGLVSVKRHGGVAMVQDPEDAAHPDMPRNALANLEVDYCLPVKEIASTLADVVCDANEDAGEPLGQAAEGTRLELNLREIEEGEGPEGPASISCPACGGALELRRGDPLQFECRAGHRYSAENLIAVQTDDVERALWLALRLLEKHGAFAKRMAKHWRALESEGIADEFDKKAAEDEENARVLRRVLSAKPDPDKSDSRIRVLPRLFVA